MAPQDDIHALQQLIASTLALLTQFMTTLTTPPPPSATSTTAATTSPTPQLNPLAILRDASTLLKAHVTKLSLLAINPPFTPTALTKVLREASSTCLPAMMSAVEILSTTKVPAPTSPSIAATTPSISSSESTRKKWSHTLVSEARQRVRRVMKEMEVLLTELSSISSAAASGKPVFTSKAAMAKKPVNAARRDSLASTGVVWEACDAVGELAVLGEAGLAVRLAEEWRDMIRDAIEELREWREGEDLDAEGRDRDVLLDSEDEGVGGQEEDAQGTLEDIFNAANSLPADRAELRELAVEAERRLKKVVLLYTAVVKRRLKTFKESEEDGRVEVLDETMVALKRLPSEVDELVANCFYDLDEDAVKSKMAGMILLAKTIPSRVALSWDGKEDEFTAWTKKWEEAIS